MSRPEPSGSLDQDRGPPAGGLSLLPRSLVGAWRVARAIVDPERRLALDVEPANNEWLADRGPARRAATRWAARYLLWLQTLLETQAVLG